MLYNLTRITARSDLPVADPDLQIRGGGGGAGHPDPEIIGGGAVFKKKCRPFGPQFGPKIRPGPSSRSTTSYLNLLWKKTTAQMHVNPGKM